MLSTDLRGRNEKRNGAYRSLNSFHYMLIVLIVSIRVNQALQFDGVDDHVSLPSIRNLGLTDR